MMGRRNRPPVRLAPLVHQYSDVRMNPGGGVVLCCLMPATATVLVDLWVRRGRGAPDREGGVAVGRT